MKQAPRSMELRSNGTFLMTIGALESQDIATTEDLKRYVQDVTGIHWGEIAVRDGQSGDVYDDEYELPHEERSVLEVSILRVYFSIRHSHKSSGIYTAYVSTGSLVGDECVRHRLLVGDGVVMHEWSSVSLLLDTFESLKVANGDIFYIEDKQANGSSRSSREGQDNA